MSFHVTERELQLQALKRYEAVCGRGEERLVSGSDDFTLFLWQPERDKRPVGRSPLMPSFLSTLLGERIAFNVDAVILGACKQLVEGY